MSLLHLPDLALRHYAAELKSWLACALVGNSASKRRPRVSQERHTDCLPSRRISRLQPSTALRCALPEIAPQLPASHKNAGKRAVRKFGLLLQQRSTSLVPDYLPSALHSPLLPFSLISSRGRQLRVTSVSTDAVLACCDVKVY